MASTFSDLKIELIATGEQSGTWGNTTNTNLGTAIEQAITGSGDVPFSSADVTLTLTDTNASQTARNLRLNLTGTSGGARNLIVPAIEKQYIVNNGLADTVTVKNSTGTGVAVPAGKTMVVFNNATNVVDVTNYASSLALGTALPITSGGTGQTTYTDGQLLIGNSSGNTLTKATLTQGSGVTITNGNGSITIAATGLGGDVVGPSSATDNAVARFDLTTGKLLQNSAVTIADTTGDITGGKYNGLTVSTTTGTFTLTNSKTFAVQNTLTLAGTDSTTMTFPSTSATVARTDAGQTFTGTQVIQAATTQDAVALAGRAGGTGSFAVTLTPATLSSNTTLTLPNVTDTVATIGTAQTFTAAQTFRAANAIRSEAAATQDAVVLAGRAGGTSSYAATITPATLSANRTVTIPDETFTVGYRNIPPVGTQTGSYILAVGDVGKYVQVSTGGSITIPDATFSEGDAISIFNNTSAGITITCSITTAYIAGTDSDKATMTLATRGMATILFISGTVCVVSGNVS